MQRFITGLTLTTACLTSFGLLPSPTASASATNLGMTLSQSGNNANLTQPYNQAPCPAPNSLSPTVKPDSPQSEVCNPWSVL